MEQSHKGEASEWKWFLLLVLLVVGVFCAYWFFSALLLPTGPERGLFGDMFGGLNALFSGLAFAGVVFALRLQMRELALQREEMKQSREELARTADAQAQQVKLLARQVEAMESQFRDALTKRSRQTAPAFKYLNPSSFERQVDTDVENHGAVIKKLSGTALGNFQVTLHPSDVVPSGGRLTIRFKFEGERPKPPFVFNLDCEDIDGLKRTFRIETDPSTRYFELVDVAAPAN